MYIGLDAQRARVGLGMRGPLLRSKRYGMRVVCCYLIVFQARYFKTMLKQAEHLEKVKRMKVGEKDLAPLAVYYEVRLNGYTLSFLRSGMP
jgi:hypothetical protein